MSIWFLSSTMCCHSLGQYLNSFTKFNIWDVSLWGLNCRYIWCFLPLRHLLFRLISINICRSFSFFSNFSWRHDHNSAICVTHELEETFIEINSIVCTQNMKKWNNFLLSYSLLLIKCGAQHTHKQDYSTHLNRLTRTPKIYTLIPSLSRPERVSLAWPTLRDYC